MIYLLDKLVNAALKNGFNIKTGRIGIDTLIKVELFTDPPIVLLELEVDIFDKNVMRIFRHRTKELTNQYKHRKVSVDWVIKFMESNVKLAKKLIEERENERIALQNQRKLEYERKEAIRKENMGLTTVSRVSKTNEQIKLEYERKVAIEKENIERKKLSIARVSIPEQSEKQPEKPKTPKTKPKTVTTEPDWYKCNACGRPIEFCRCGN